MPWLLTRPVGRTDADDAVDRRGNRIDPPVSVPISPKHARRATARRSRRSSRREAIGVHGCVPHKVRVSEGRPTRTRAVELEGLKDRAGAAQQDRHAIRGIVDRGANRRGSCCPRSWSWHLGRDVVHSPIEYLCRAAGRDSWSGALIVRPRARLQRCSSKTVDVRGQLRVHVAAMRAKRGLHDLDRTTSSRRLSQPATAQGSVAAARGSFARPYHACHRQGAWTSTVAGARSRPSPDASLARQLVCRLHPGGSSAQTIIRRATSTSGNRRSCDRRARHRARRSQMPTRGQRSIGRPGSCRCGSSPQGLARKTAAWHLLRVPCGPVRVQRRSARCRALGMAGSCGRCRLDCCPHAALE